MPTASNSINESTTGISGFNGTAFVGTPVTAHAVIIGGATSSALINVGPTSTAGQILQSAGAAADPAFSTPTYPSASGSTGTILRSDGTNNVYTTATYPSTTTINQILYSSSASVIGGLATANNGVLTTGATGIPAITALSSNGQLIIGSGSGAPTAATLSAGSGVTITNAANSITIATSAGGMTWSDTSGTFTASINNGYFLTAASTPTLPASPSNGDIVIFICDTASTVTVTGNTGQVIRVGSVASAAAGTAVSSTNGNSLTLRYRVSDTTWIAQSIIGTWAIT